ncbi:sodium:solute symporter family protein [Anoxybacterium hadale]|uniref:Sodium:solute symporter family protein n=1 Tax=Anoxybacterium hadale TaxID=3408580 RepID=A0ACD1A6R1_9FIRM|nr:sodium:solute symporter family protein [Clostridiales bacterium]
MSRVIIYMIYFTLYTVVLLFWGKSGFKKTNTIKDFCVAGNSLGLFISVSTFTATLFSAVSMQSVTGSVYQFGYSTILYSVIGWLLGGSCLIFVAYKIKEYDIVTVSDYLRIRYHSRNYQAFTGAVTVICYILYIIIQIKGFGIVVSELLDINYNIAILLIYLFIVYTGFGGLFSVAKTDALNIILVLAGVLLVAGNILFELGGITAIHKEVGMITGGASLDPTTGGLFSPIMIITTGMAWGLGTAANPQYIIRISSAKDKKTGIMMICIAVYLLSLIYLGLMVIGMGSRVMAPTIDSVQSVDEILAYIINTKLYAYTSGVMFISIIAAAISTANSQLLLLSSSFTYDIYINLFKREISNERFLNINRVIIFIAGTVSLLLSIQPLETLLIYGSYIWSIVAVTFLCPLYGGLYWKRATRQGAVFSSAGGILAVLFFYLATHGGVLKTEVHPVLPSILLSMAIFYVVSVRTYRPQEG